MRKYVRTQCEEQQKRTETHKQFSTFSQIKSKADLHMSLSSRESPQSLQTKYALMQMIT